MMQPLAPNDPRHAGEFRLSARLGVGGMGQVFLGYSPGGRTVAVKVCHPELAADPSFVERFAREATAAQAVNGLYTAQVVAAGPYDKPPWLATAYVPGPPLSDYVEDHGPLPEPAAWRLAAGLAEALLAVHACGLVHRDLKPSNVLLAIDGPRVIDFGIASALEASGLTTTGSVLGSPPYMSPEQAMGQPSGPASDVFALGSTLAFAACGAPPFGEGDAAALLFRVVHMPPALDSVPARLREVVAACLVKDPAGRPTLPDLLRACQDGAAAGGNSAASFWPAQMTAAIARHESSAAGRAGSGQTVPPGGSRDPHPPTVAASVFSRPPAAGQAAGPAAGGTGSPAAGGAGGAAAGFLRRRRLLSGVGGLVVAGGLAAVGWELASGGKSAAGAGTAAGHVTDKRTAWTRAVGEQVVAGPVISVDGSTLYVGGAGGTVYALDAASGRLGSKYQAGGAVSGLTVAGGTLLAGSADGKVHALDIGHGGLGVSWTSAAAGAGLTGAPSSGGGVVYTGSNDGYFYALDMQTGERKWRTPAVGAAVAGQPEGTNVVSAASRNGTVYLLDTGSGDIVGRYQAGGAVNSAPLDQLGDLCFGTGKGMLYNVEFDDIVKSVTQRWKFTADGAIAATPAASGDTYFTATARGTVYAVGSGTGNQLWRHPVGSPVRAGLAFESGVLYVGSDDGQLTAIDISGPSVRWRAKTSGAIRSRILVAGPGPLVYFGNLSHQVHALHP